ncbi:AraC family transcriptional regulator [Flavobacterium sp. 5]|uniref:helix-turn-helix domain-containing protein n=1 Tax=Flavobacterium sp. 5 TaxID=2035199 RepID=UPI000C2BC4E8|nr:helix-turn-helix transcriptional regulator [Flavobacterium sp. 5]PKB15303.1 AraC-like DNA-binding protein [Flavobacterium sp. 5]
MRKTTRSIPVNPLAEEFDTGIAIREISFGDVHLSEETSHSHRHNYHFFLLQEKGTSIIEIDFENYDIKNSAVVYIHPNQVHRILKTNDVTCYILAMSSDRLNREYLELLEDLAPVHPLAVTTQNFSVIAHVTELCVNIFKNKQTKLYQPLLKDCCNALVALIISQYLEESNLTDKLSRFDSTTKAFKTILEKDFAVAKRPADYAKKLNISVAYLNECVKNATGFSVSHHIQQRVILEAKRLLHHSNKSVKEIASELNFDDYAYFSRLFSKVSGMTALAFRNKNHD